MVEKEQLLPRSICNISIVCYCMVLHSIAWCCLLLHIIAWYCLLLHVNVYYCLALFVNFCHFMRVLVHRYSLLLHFNVFQSLLLIYNGYFYINDSTYDTKLHIQDYAEAFCDQLVICGTCPIYIEGNYYIRDRTFLKLKFLLNSIYWIYSIF